MLLELRHPNGGAGFASLKRLHDQCAIYDERKSGLGASLPDYETITRDWDHAKSDITIWPLRGTTWYYTELNNARLRYSPQTDGRGIERGGVTGVVPRAGIQP